jgi:hypothetical protein
MKRLLIALGLLALALIPRADAQAPIVGPGQFIMCPFSFQTNITSATTTQLVAGVTGQRVYVCGWHVTSISATSSTFQFEYGTGASCTTPTVLTPPFNVTSTAPSADHQTYAIGPNGGAGQTLCAVTTGTPTGTAVLVYYSQF